MSDDKEKKRSMFKRLFSSDGSKKKKSSLTETSMSEKDRKELDQRKRLQRSCTIAAPEGSKNPNISDLTISPRRGSAEGLKSNSEAKKSSAAKGKEAEKRRVREKREKKEKESRAAAKKRKNAKKFDLAGPPVEPTQPLEYPCTPEIILEHHKFKPFLNNNEEWLLVELNEFECLVDSPDIIKIIAKHSKFFEVDPDELWEEFFEFVEEIPAYDEVINYDIWQEFRDEKYPC